MTFEADADDSGRPLAARQAAELAIRELGSIVASGDLAHDEKLRALLRLGCRHLGVSTGIVSRVEGGRTIILAANDEWGMLEVGDVVPSDWPEAHTGVPLQVNARHYGTLVFHDPTPRDLPFGDVEVDFLQLLAQLLVTVLERRELERMKQEFLSVVSHELRTPLTSVRGALGLLASGRLGALDERGQRMLAIAGQNTDRLVQMINDILDLERMQSGAMELKMGSASAGELIRAALEEVRPAADRAGVRLEFEASETPVVAHRDRIVQVLSNLAGNAVKYSRAGSLVSVRAESRGGTVRFEVEDNGPGIPADRLERIFQRFEQVDSSDTRTAGGSGLGLAIARGIVEQHGGNIAVESRLGEGSRFHFDLQLFGRRQPAARPAPEPPLVLICDDDQAVCRFLELALEARGYHARSVQSGEEIVTLAARHSPAVILLDFQLSGIDGRDTLSLLRQWPETRRIPVIMLSGQRREESGIGESEIVAWIDKPIDQASLFDALLRAFEGTPLHADVLVVEDDEELAEVVAESLSVSGLSSYHTRTGADALRLARTLPFDLLVLDVRLPDRDGFAVVESMRGQARLQNLPLLVVSAADLDEPDRARLRMGPTEFLVKSQQPVRYLGDRAIALLGRPSAPVVA